MANDNQGNGEIVKWKNRHFKTCNFVFQSFTLVNIICFNNIPQLSYHTLSPIVSFSTLSLVLTMYRDVNVSQGSDKPGKPGKTAVFEGTRGKHGKLGEF